MASKNYMDYERGEDDTDDEDDVDDAYNLFVEIQATLDDPLYVALTPEEEQDFIVFMEEIDNPFYLALTPEEIMLQKQAELAKEDETKYLKAELKKAEATNAAEKKKKIDAKNDKLRAQILALKATADKK